MRIDSIDLVEGSTITNLTTASGGADPVLNLSTGELFYRTDTTQLRVYTGTMWINVGGGGGTPGGADTQVQYNDMGSFGGDSGLTFNETTDTLSVGGAIRNAVGTTLLPSYTFTGDPDTGIYHSAADQVSVAIAGSESLRVASQGILVAPGGSAGAPSITYINDSNTGFYNNSSDALFAATAGARRWTWDANGNAIINDAAGALLTTATNGFLYIATMPGVPTGVPTAYTGKSPIVVDTLNNRLYGYDPVDNTWLNLTGSGGGTPGGADTQVQFNNSGAFDGDSQFAWITGTNRLVIDGTISNAVGLSTAPSYTFTGDLDTGIYHSGINEVSVAIAGVQKIKFDSTGVTVLSGFFAPGANTPLTPEFSFTGDANTGMFSSGADTINFATGGISRMSIGSTGVTFSVPLSLGSNTLTATTFLGAQGGASTPSFTFTGDTDTGLYTATLDNLFVGTGGTRRWTWDSLGNAAIHAGGGALATTATDGFLHISSMAGVPTGVPTAFSGRVPIVVDTTNNRMYGYDATESAWINLTAAPGSGQSAIQFRDEAVNLGASGTVDVVDFVGAGVTATRVSNTLTVTIAGGAGSPAGLDMQVQYNDVGSFGGDTGLTFNETTDTLAVGGVITNAFGTALLPSYAFTTNLNTGIYRSAVDTIGFSAGGVSVATMSATGVSAGAFTVPPGGKFLAPTAGVPGAPNFTFTGDLDTGIFNFIPDAVGISGAGMIAALFSPGGIFAGPTGSVGAPSISFMGDTNTGLYNSTADNLFVTTAATQRFVWDSVGNAVVGTGALATSATAGFLYITTMPGAPLGIPTTYTGRAALVLDTTGNALYGYDPVSAVWLNLTGAGGGTLDDLTDVIITAPTNGQVLSYDGVNWTNSRVIAYDLAAQVLGTAGTSVPRRIMQFVAVRPFRITASGHRGFVVTGPTGTNAVFTVYHNASSIGTVTFTIAGGNDQAVTFSLTQTDVVAGGRVDVQLTTADSNNILADVMITLQAFET